VRLDETAREIVAFLGNEAKLHGVRIEVDAPDGLPPVLADEIELEQVLVNLVLNALDAVADVPAARRRIRIELTADQDDAVEVRVVDAGVGIAPEHASRLFDQFFTTKPHGMGMGLAMCRSIAESLGGRLELVANAEFGATARLRLPAAASHPTGAPHAAAVPDPTAVPVPSPSPAPTAPPSASKRRPRGSAPRPPDGTNRLLPDRKEVR
jgi:C4-dicarboxylate-specific signal transduction histidine kinase